MSCVTLVCEQLNKQRIMDKAARAVRRSSVKLMSLGGGHTDLHVLLSEVKDMRNTAKAFMNAQNAVSQDLLKWAVNEENRALQDVANQLAELNLLWTEVQREFGEHLKDYRHMFEMILEGEKHVSQSRNNFAACEQREMKVRKELKKAFKKSSTSEIQNLECRLSQAERAKHLAQIEVTDRTRENEAVKLIRLKEGLMKLSQAYSDFARKCTVVFDAQQDIVQQLPDVLDQDLEDMKYTGSGVTRYRVQQAKEKVRNYRRYHDNRSLPQKYSEPPPPYSLSDDFETTSPSIMASSEPVSSSPRRRVCTLVKQPLAPQQMSTAPPSSNQLPSSASSVLPPQAPVHPPTPGPFYSSDTTVPVFVPIPKSSDPSQPPPQAHPTMSQPPLMEAIVPEVPADLRTKMKPVAVFSEEEELSSLTPNQVKDIVDLVDFDRHWDDSYEEDLSGAMGGAKI